MKRTQGEKNECMVGIVVYGDKRESGAETVVLDGDVTWFSKYLKKKLYLSNVDNNQPR